MERDPVCGMTVDPAKAAATWEHASKTYYFCCKSCATKFSAAPEKYLNAKPEPMAMPGHGGLIQLGGIQSAKPAPIVTTTPSQGSASASTKYICPMCPEVSKNAPGPCTKCGMALEPSDPGASATKTEYTCPMHPEIVRAEPGSCPICGMALEPRTVAIEEENPELVMMSRRFWICAALTLPVLLLGMS